MYHKSISEQVDKYRKHCLWSSAEDSNRVNAMVAWPVVTKPKEEGGLGSILWGDRTLRSVIPAKSRYALIGL